MIPPSPRFGALFGRAGLLTMGFYVAIFFVFGAWLPFWPLWMEDWGLSQSEIGLWLGLAIFVRIAAGVGAPWLADLTGKRRSALALLGAVGVAAFLLPAFADSRAALFALTLLGAVALAGVIPLGDALATAAGRRHGFAYAPARAVGSAAFLLANLACGWAVARWGVDAALVWIVASFLAVIGFSLAHPGGARDAADPRPDFREALRLARARPFVLAAIASAAIQAAHGPLYAYGAVHWRAQGIDADTIGALWAIGVAAEVALMLAFGAALTERLGVAGAFVLAGLAGLARWLAMAFDPSLAVLWPLQLLHALSFAPAHLAMVAFVAQAAPPASSASAQGLIGAGAGGLAMALATLFSAQAYPALGGGVYWIGVALALIGLAAASALGRAWDGGRVG